MYILFLFKISGVLCEPLSCIIHGLDKLPEIKIGSEILIVGAGIIGVLWSCVLHLLGHKRVYVSEPNANRRKILNNLGYKIMNVSAYNEEEIICVNFRHKKKTKLNLSKKKNSNLRLQFFLSHIGPRN